ncbi:heme ABC exporter ATP-binding protein CcmA [Asticcacaulis solisilvae]|uniref:heme ABC exporter ATP-binding protein CcmA n=1 Tax=Asticcacaulis solisilvae TaxID=1217274 RepID=UPI003FD8A256
MPLELKVNGLALKKGYNLLISGVDFTLSPGEALSLAGENGVGKTTLLRTLAGFAPSHAGNISFVYNDRPLESEEAQAKYIHLLGHHDALSPSRTVAQELEFQADFLGGEVANAVDALNLKTLLDLETRYLSAGQKRRLSCARLLMAKRSLWLLDEPMAPLDADHRALIAGLMQTHLAAGGMLIAAVHDPLPFETRILRLTRPTLAEREAALG